MQSPIALTFFPSHLPSITLTNQIPMTTRPQLMYIHSLDKSLRNFCRSHSKTYEKSIFSTSSIVCIYYVIDRNCGDFCPVSVYSRFLTIRNSHTFAKTKLNQ